jgi:murein DD-endopeptidase MepM/ murein hydrolase activator NlpD
MAQWLCRPIYLLAAINLFYIFCFLLFLSDHKMNSALFSKFDAASRKIDFLLNKQIEPVQTMASGFVFYDLSLPAWAKGFRIPITGAQISQREDLLPGAIRSYRNGRHEGVDIYCTYGAPVLAAKDGYVLTVSADYHELSRAFRDRLLGIAHKLVSTPAEVTDILHGRRVILDHGYKDGRWVITIYSHLSEVEEYLKPGDFIKQGSIIGYAGNSGTSQVMTRNGSHLHFEIRVNDHYLGEGMSQQEASKLYALIMNGGQE